MATEEGRKTSPKLGIVSRQVKPTLHYYSLSLVVGPYLGEATEEAWAAVKIALEEATMIGGGRRRLVGGRNRRCWSPPNRDATKCSLSFGGRARFGRFGATEEVGGGGGDRRDSEERCGARPRYEAAVDAAAVRAVEGDDDGDGFGGGGETGSEEDEGRRCGGSETGTPRWR
ncbi:hypothetical protein Scep_026331 [Stephania cephalantha]|uniref:Uncharacterized protein n=1 Tax=Stephania cephalantha TaxID=152367 RepID=A0AAP0EQ80_9MAGN